MLPCRKAAFSLMELAIGLVGAGLVVGLALQLKPADDKVAKCYEATRVELNAIKAALLGYSEKNKRLPRPAADDSGLEGAVASITASTDTNAYIGNLPYKTLGLSREHLSDCFANGANSNYRYVVSQRLTDKTTYSSVNHQVTVRVDPDPFGAPAVSAAYAVISHGKTGNCNGAVASSTAAGAGNPTNCVTSTNLSSLAPTVTTIPSQVDSFPFNLTAKSAAFFDAMVAYDTIRLPCSGDIYWNGSNVGGPTNASGPCHAVVPTAPLPTYPLNPGGTAPITNIASTNLGSGTVKCVAGAPGTDPHLEVLPGATCDCKALQNVSWNGTSTAFTSGLGGPCSATTTRNTMSSGPTISRTEDLKYNDPVTDPTKYTGSVTATCTDGTLVPSGATCAAPCLSAPFSWGPGGACTVTRPHIASGNSATLTAASPYNGTATVSCLDGVLSLNPGSTCNADPCPAQPNYVWAAPCEGNMPAVAYTMPPFGAGATTSAPVTYSLSGHTGSATATCTTPGGPSTITGTCSPNPCTGGSISWGSACTGTAPASISSGAAISIPNVTGGYTGTLNATCTAGTLTTTGTCAPDNCTTPWSTTLWHGTSVTAYNSSTCDDRTLTCNLGILSGGATGYDQASPTPCTTYYISWATVGNRRGDPLPTIKTAEGGSLWHVCEIPLTQPTAAPAPGCSHGFFSNCPSGGYYSRMPAPYHNASMGGTEYAAGLSTWACKKYYSDNSTYWTSSPLVSVQFPSMEAMNLGLPGYDPGDDLEIKCLVTTSATGCVSDP